MTSEIAADKPTKRKIIRAAVPLFATRGVAGVSVKDIAEAAGVNVALISYYFGGKENLYASVLKFHMDLWERTIAVLAAADLPPVEKLQRFVNTAMDLHKKHPYLNRLFLNELVNPTKYFELLVDESRMRLRQLFQDWLREGISQGLFRPDIDPYCAALALNNLVHFYFATAKFSDQPGDEDARATRYFEQAIAIYLHGVMR